MKDTKEHILNVAYALFLRNSYKGVTMAEIVKKTKLSKGAFYHYFKSKEELFLEVLTQYFSKVMICNYSKLSKDSLYQFYHDLITKAQCSFVDAKDKSISFADSNYVFLMFEGMRIFPEFQKEIYKHLDTELTEWTNVIKIARKKGEIKTSMTDEQVAKLFIFTNDGVGMRMILGRKLDYMVEEITSMWDGLYSLLKA